MKIYFKTINPAQRAASRLPLFLTDIAPLRLGSTGRNCTAFVLGHEDWATLSKSCAQNAPLSLRDENCSPDDLTTRRAFQAARLEEFCGRHDLNVDGNQIVAEWRPFAARPQEKTESFVYADQRHADGHPQRCLMLLQELESSGRLPEQNEVDYIIERFAVARGFTLELVETFAGPLAIRLMNMKDGDTEVLAQPILHADETPVRVLQPGSKTSNRGYLRAYAPGVFQNLREVVYDFTEGRSGAHARTFLGDWHGSLICDDYSGYKTSFDQGVTEVGCMAHVRRKFHARHQANKSQIAEQALASIRALYAIKAQSKTLASEARLRLRQEQARPLAEALHAWLLAHREKVPGNSGISRAGIAWAIQRPQLPDCLSNDHTKEAGS